MSFGDIFVFGLSLHYMLVLYFPKIRGSPNQGYFCAITLTYSTRYARTAISAHLKLVGISTRKLVQQSPKSPFGLVAFSN